MIVLLLIQYLGQRPIYDNFTPYSIFRKGLYMKILLLIQYLAKGLYIIILLLIQYFGQRP